MGPQFGLSGEASGAMQKQGRIIPCPVEHLGPWLEPVELWQAIPRQPHGSNLGLGLLSVLVDRPQQPVRPLTASSLVFRGAVGCSMALSAFLFSGRKSQGQGSGVTTWMGVWLTWPPPLSCVSKTG